MKYCVAIKLLLILLAYKAFVRSGSIKSIVKNDSYKIGCKVLTRYFFQAPKDHCHI